MKINRTPADVVVSDPRNEYTLVARVFLLPSVHLRQPCERFDDEQVVQLTVVQPKETVTVADLEPCFQAVREALCRICKTRPD